MSSSLKERLKKQNQCHGLLTMRNRSTTKSLTSSELQMNSSLPESDKSVVTKERFENSDGDYSNCLNDTPKCLLTERVTTNKSEKELEMTALSPSTASKDIQGELDKWRNELATKEEIVRKLKLVKLYRSKNDLTELQQLIIDWRTACQNALLDYLDKIPQPKPTIGELLDHLHIDYKLLNYDSELEEFI